MILSASGQQLLGRLGRSARMQQARRAARSCVVDLDPQVRGGRQHRRALLDEGCGSEVLLRLPRIESRPHGPRVDREQENVARERIARPNLARRRDAERIDVGVGGLGRRALDPLLPEEFVGRDAVDRLLERGPVTQLGAEDERDLLRLRLPPRPLERRTGVRSAPRKILSPMVSRTPSLIWMPILA